MGSPKQTFTGNLERKGNKKKGKITVNMEQISHNNDAIYFTGKGYNFPTAKKFFCCGSDDPFYFIERSREPDSDEFIRILQGTTQRGTTDPTWNRLKYKARKICNGDENNRIKFKFYSWSDSGDHTPYGEFITSLNQLKNGEHSYQLNRMDSNTPVGNATFEFQELYIEERPSFYQFLHSGWQMNLTVGVDFTASNGPVTYADSLHYLDPSGRPNQYETALQTVGSILVNYDSDQMIPSFGFGAVPSYNPAKQVSHCFHLNGSEDPRCNSVYGMMDAYKFSLRNCTLYGPTYFAPLIQTFLDYVGQNMGNPIYHILLILTDGDIHDMAATKSLVVSASEMPVSIIIIGVGNENFELMEELDADNFVLRDSSGRIAKRDIVQFVKFNDYAHRGFQAISEEVLREVPDQVVDYLVKNNIKV